MKEAVYIVGTVRSFGPVTSVMSIPVFPPEKFHFYPKHTNARQLVSRNKREGWYCGINSWALHCRVGKRQVYSLRDRAVIGKGRPHEVMP